MRRISILGATGSIGRSTLDLIVRNPESFHLVALTAQQDADGLAQAALATRAELAVIGDPACHARLAERLAGSGIRTAAGKDAIVAAARLDADWVMAAIVGAAGLPPVLAALEQGRTVALANKESIICAGALMLAAARASGATILPVDSEHNAIFQALAGNDRADVERVILTASGGPFRGRSRAQMRSVRVEDALKHPNWSMGAKITIDSATLMNKGLELIEAHHLFGLPSAQLQAIVHPQSVIHSMVEYRDGSILAQLGPADMRVPIASCLAWPGRMATPVDRVDFARLARLDFAEPDLDAFPCLALARAAMEAGGARPAVLNAANEVAVAAFLDRRIGFLDIAAIVAATLETYQPAAPTSIDDVFAIDAESRRWAGQIEAAMERESLA